LSHRNDDCDENFSVFADINEGNLRVGEEMKHNGALERYGRTRWVIPSRES
jgi:hypothetical protein